MVRIRYIKEGTFLISKYRILCNTIPVEIVIDTINMNFILQDAATKEFLIMERASTINQLKAKAKLATIKLGAQYFDEIRNTKTKKRRLDI